MQQVLDCIDAGTDYCPCYLAEIGECILCSQLQGKTFCDCRNWKGVCIYQEYVANKNRMKDSRKTYLCRIVKKEAVNQQTLILTVLVSHTMARELNQPGAFVFMRDIDDPFFFDTPMSIMRANEREKTIEIAVQVRGVKTKALKDLGDDVIIRGPYWNGLLGLKYLKILKNSKALLITRGIGQAPAVSVARKLVLAGNTVEVILDKGRADSTFALDYFKELDCDIRLGEVLDGKSLTVPKEILKYIKQSVQEQGVKLIYSGGSDKLHKGITKLLSQIGEDVYFVCSNDARFCCGEGVCGSCHARLSDGSRIKVCKTQLNPTEIL